MPIADRPRSPSAPRSRSKQLDQLDHLERRATALGGGSAQRQRRAEDRHQAVADHLVDDAAVRR